MALYVSELIIIIINHYHHHNHYYHHYHDNHHNHHHHHHHHPANVTLIVTRLSQSQIHVPDPGLWFVSQIKENLIQSRAGLARIDSIRG